MTITINKHGETETIIGTIRSSRGGREPITITEFQSGGVLCFSLKAVFVGHPDAARFSTQVRRAKDRFSDPSLAAEWND